MPVPQTVRSPMYATAMHRALPLVLAGALFALRSQRSLIPDVLRLTHPRGRWPSWWPNLVAPLAARPLLLLPCLVYTIPSATASFRTSLLVYHLLSLSPNV